VRIVHRDFPLPQHPHAQLAARYANAAGELGVYEAVFHRLFETQAEWSANGNIEAALGPVLKPELLARIRDKVAHDTKVEESMKIDMVKGATGDKLTQTPSLVVAISDGQRHVLSGAPSFVVLSAYLDEVVVQGGRR
jgi:protein-disulfide isomerase